MSLSLKNFALAAVAAATLVACGGGGGSGPEKNTNFSVRGQAAKGIIVGAAVVAQQWNATTSEWVNIAGAEDITNADGEFDIQYREEDVQGATVRLHVFHPNKLDAKSQLLKDKVLEKDTTDKEITNKFIAKIFNESTKAFENMPENFELSSFVVDSKNNINAYTQLAFAAAAGNYDAVTVKAANDLANKLFEGVPGSHNQQAHALVSEAHKPSTDGNAYDNAMAQLLATPGCDAICVQNKIDTAITANIKIIDGKAVVGDITELHNLGITNISKEDLNFSLNASGSSLSFDQFVNNLRGSFKKLKGNWNTSDQTLQQRYSDLTTHGTMSIAASVKDMLENCVFWDGETNAACFDEEGWSTNDGGKTYTKSYTNPQGIDMLVTASGTHTSSSFNMRYVAEQKKDGVAFEKADLVLSGSGVNASAEDIGQMVVGQSVKMMLNGTIEKVGVGSANKTTVTIKDMGVEVSGVKLREADSGNVHLDANDSTMKLQGDVGFSSNFGDTAKGLVSATILNKVVGTADDTVPVVQKLDASLEITPKDAALQSAKLSLSGNFTPAEASSNGFAVVNLNAYAKVNNGDVVKFDLSRTAADKATASLTVGVGSDAIVAKVEAVQTQIGAAQALPDYCFDVEQKLFCAKDLNLSSSDGKFKAVVNADTLQGDLTHNGTKFGEISKSGITFDGKKYSFY